MPNASIKVNMREFQRWFKRNREYSRRGLAEDVNQSAYSVAIGAVAMTKRGSKGRIRSYLMGPSNVNPKAPIAAILINSKRSAKGSRGLYGAAMREAVIEFVRKQQDSINFLRAGWLPAVQIFGNAIGKSIGANAVQFLSRFGYGGGGAEKAKRGINPIARLWNSSFSRHTSTDNGIQFAEAGLRKAIDRETNRMRSRVTKKLASL